MNIFLIIAMILINIIAIVIVYQILKKQPKKEILIFIASGVAIIYLIISVIYWLSGFGIDTSVHESSKNFVVFMFVPINVILFMPYIAVQYKKIRQNKKIEKYDIENLSKKVTIVILIFAGLSIGEFFYFKNIQNNIKELSELRTNNEISNTVLDGTNNIFLNEVENINKNETVESVNNSVNEYSNTTLNTMTNTTINEMTNQVNEV
ncbi:MAG: hypothetical protein J6M60_03075 [Clostridia bacterium]|nr:hypothetical protein [Clostridia bacterium]